MIRPTASLVAFVASWVVVSTSLAAEPEAVSPETVTFAGPHTVTLKGLFYRPSTAHQTNVGGPSPAVIALHGCGGNGRANGESARVTDWSQRFLAAGFVVLWPDSFGSRGLGAQCLLASRSITPAQRALDAVAASNWLATRTDVDKDRIVLVGWSNGGSTVLRAVSHDVEAPRADYKLAIAFYPGCRPITNRMRREPAWWSPRVPLTILMGGADDWTPPGPCRELGARNNVRYLEYAGAYHGFDAPDTPVRIRRNLAYTADGRGAAHVGTDPAARAAAITEVMRLLDGASR